MNKGRLHWVKSHIGIDGYEEANTTAKKATWMQNSTALERLEVTQRDF